MPISGALDPTAHVFRTTLSGRISITDLSQHITTVRRLRAHEYPGLVDARGVHTLTFNRRELMRFAQDLRTLFGSASPAPRAVVVDGLVYFGMARLFASLVAGWIRIGVFDDVAAAEEWLAAFISVS
ncbi:MAG TPA: hypothetical protein VN700_19750 [Vicinamibacterales bacterium]|nr:hypothetical protein [Vicinamibacterales bacterium]